MKSTSHKVDIAPLLENLYKARALYTVDCIFDLFYRLVSMDTMSPLFGREDILSVLALDVLSMRIESTGLISQAYDYFPLLREAYGLKGQERQCDDHIQAMAVIDAQGETPGMVCITTNSSTLPDIAQYSDSDALEPTMVAIEFNTFTGKALYLRGIHQVEIEISTFTNILKSVDWRLNLISFETIMEATPDTRTWQQTYVRRYSGQARLKKVLPTYIAQVHVIFKKLFNTCDSPGTRLRHSKYFLNVRAAALQWLVLSGMLQDADLTNRWSVLVGKWREFCTQLQWSVQVNRPHPALEEKANHLLLETQETLCFSLESLCLKSLKETDNKHSFKLW